MPAHHSRAAAAAAAAFALLGPLATAQVPPHHAVVGTVSIPPFAAPQRGVTGIYAIPLPTTANPGPQTPRPITGLPTNLRVPTSEFGGVASLWLSDDGTRLLVGNYTHNLRQVQIQVLDLIGMAVRPGSRAFTVGTVARGFGQGASAIRELPDGRFLICTGGTTGYTPGSGPAAISPLAILDLDAPVPSLTAVPLRSPLTGFPGPAVLSPGGRFAYVFTQAGSAAPPWRLFEVDIDDTSPSHGSVALLHTFQSGALHHPRMEDDRRIVAAASDLGQVRTELVEIDTGVRPVAVRSTPLSPSGTTVFGPFQDRASGAALYTSLATPGSVFGNDLLIAPGGPTTPMQVLASEPAAGWGFPYATCIREAMQPYGRASGGAGRFRFELAPHPDGLPELGNAGFGLRVVSATATPTSAWMLFGVLPDSIQVLGLELLVQPLATVDMIVQNQRAQLGLPIANDLALVGVTVHAQALLIDNGGLDASEGLRFTLIR